MYDLIKIRGGIEMIGLMILYAGVVCGGMV